MADTAISVEDKSTGFIRGLGLLDSTMIVAGSMIGSGIFIVSADMARQVGSPGWLLVAWVITGLLTVMAALSYGELAAMMPKAGGQYVYLREAFSPLWGFLYGWTLFLVIQSGTIAAVAVGFGRYLGVLVPWVSESHYLIKPINIGSRYAVSLSTAQLIGVLLIALLTWMNTRGLKLGKLVQNVFTVTKTGARRPDPARPRRRLQRDGGARQLRRLLDGARQSSRRRRHHRRDRLRPVRRPVRHADQLAVFRRRLEQHHLHRRRSQRPQTQHPAVTRFRDVPGHWPLPAGQRRLSGDAAIHDDPDRAERPGGVGHRRGDLRQRGRDHHGHRHHDLDLRLQQWLDPGGGARLLGDGA